MKAKLEIVALKPCILRRLKRDLGRKHKVCRSKSAYWESHTIECDDSNLYYIGLLSSMIPRAAWAAIRCEYGGEVVPFARLVAIAKEYMEDRCPHCGSDTILKPLSFGMSMEIPETEDGDPKLRNVIFAPRVCGNCKTDLTAYFAVQGAATPADLIKKLKDAGPAAG